MKKILAVAALGLAPASLVAADHFWIIGGGPRPEASEAQIELNVRWVVESIRELAPDAVLHVFYANGAAPGPATVERATDLDGEAASFEALARVFGEPGSNRLRYRPHRVDDVAGGTAAATLVPELGRQLGELEPGDQGMIVYNGHGSWAPDRAGNALRLWGESRLDVRTFEALLGRVHPDVPIRFVFTQCYSGAFERAVHPGAEATLELAPGTRCGFFAESEDRLSEGCSASVQVGDYRDYTTFFFAALTGRTRLGEPVDDVVHWDDDDRITPFDAHLHAMVEGRNADLPRSTSEVYLERWQPWYLRWLGTDDLPDNLYGRAARAIAEKIGLAGDGPAAGAELARRYETLLAEVGEAERRRARLEAESRAVRSVIRDDVTERWPTLRHPYTAAHVRTVGSELGAVSSFIVGHEEYARLVGLQDELERLTVRAVELERDVSELERLRRTRMLARTLAQIRRHADDRHLDAYERLRACEALPLVGS